MFRFPMRRHSIKNVDEFARNYISGDAVRQIKRWEDVMVANRRDPYLAT
jgi:hypothetical protein